MVKVFWNQVLSLPLKPESYLSFDIGSIGGLYKDVRCSSGVRILEFSDICTCRTALRINFLQDFLSQALLHLRVLIQYVTREGKQWRSLVQIIKIRWLKGTKIYSLIMVWSIQVFNSVVLSILFTFGTNLKSCPSVSLEYSSSPQACFFFSIKLSP